MAIGVTLRSARIQRGLSIEQVAQDTRISARFIEALEDEAFNELPAPVYVRGFLRSYANYLKVDADPLLEELSRGGSAPVGGPDSFIGGPAGPQARPQRQASNPFQRSVAPPLLPVPSAPPELEAVPPLPFGDGELVTDDDDQEWDPAEAEALPEEPRRSLTGRYYENEPTVEPMPVGDEQFRPRRTPGVLMERDAAAAGSGNGTRLVVIAGGAVIAVLGILAAMVFLTGGNDNKDRNAAAPPATASPTAKTGTVIAVGSVTALASASPTASASPSASASPGGTPGTGTPAATGTAVPATATPRPGTPTPTATPSPTPEPPTPTPTKTPIPPTPKPTPTVVVFTPAPFSECTVLGVGGYDCGPSPLRVVCSPTGWFIDVGRNFVLPAGWRTTDVPYNGSLGPALTAGQAGCQ